MLKVIKKIFNLICKWKNKTSNKTKQISDNNNNNNNKSMARKTVISKVVEENAQDGIIEFPQNRTLYADQFTDNAPNTDEEREGFKAKSMKDVFEHYQPVKEGVTLSTEDGGAVYEDFQFKQIKDFEDDQLIEQSEILRNKQSKINAYNSVIRQLEKNKTLRNALKDDNARENLKNAIQALLNELKEAE